MSADADAFLGQITDMRTGAIAAHECFSSLREAGFTRNEAPYLTAVVLTGGVRTPPPGTD